MWPFRKKPESAPYRWWVEEKLEQQVILALQREPRAQLVAHVVATNAAMRNVGLDRYRREARAAALPCAKCGQLHVASLPGDCRTWWQNGGVLAASGIGDAFR